MFHVRLKLISGSQRGDHVVDGNVGVRVDVHNLLRLLHDKLVLFVQDHLKIGVFQTRAISVNYQPWRPR